MFWPFDTLTSRLMWNTMLSQSDAGRIKASVCPSRASFILDLPE
jgi:hypothetical protein